MVAGPIDHAGFYGLEYIIIHFSLQGRGVVLINLTSPKDRNGQKEREFRIFFIVHKEASFDLWDQSIHVFLICVSFLKRGVHTLKHKVSMRE